MLKQNKILLILLAVQLLLVFWLSTGSSALSVDNSKSKLFSFSLTDSSSMEIADSESSIELAMLEGQWVLPKEDNFPADQEKAEQLLAELDGLKTGLAVGNSINAAKKFAVSSDQFEKKLTLKSADKLAEIYFGNVPTFKQIYARVEGDENSYAVNFESHKLPVDSNAWFDKGLLKLKKEDIASIKLNDIELEKSESEWNISGLEEGKKLSGKELDALISAISGIAYTEIPKKKAVGGFSKTKVALEMVLNVAGESNTYTFKNMKEDSFLKLSSLPYYFKISKNQLDSLIVWKKSNLLSDDVSTVETSEEVAAGLAKETELAKEAQSAEKAQLDRKVPPAKKLDSKKVAPEQKVAVEEKL